MKIVGETMARLTIDGGRFAEPPGMADGGG